MLGEHGLASATAPPQTQQNNLAPVTASASALLQASAGLGTPGGGAAVHGGGGAAAAELYFGQPRPAELLSVSAEGGGSVSAASAGASLVSNLEGYNLESVNPAPLGGEVEGVPQDYPGRGVRVLRAEPLAAGAGRKRASGTGVKRASDTESSAGGAGGRVRAEGAGSTRGPSAGKTRHMVAQREYETWEEVGRRQRKIDRRGLDMKGMLQGDGMDVDLTDTMDSRALAQVYMCMCVYR